MITFEQGLKVLDISYTDVMLSQMDKYFQLLSERSKQFNLTSITEYDDVVAKHFLDSLSAVRVLPELTQGKKLSLIDVGSGAGLPGIPMKVFFPSLSVLMIDGTGKKIKFVNEAIELLGLGDTSAVHGRAEEMNRLPAYRERFDICVSRAVADLATLSGYCLPFVKRGGCFVAYKSVNAESEIPVASKVLSANHANITAKDIFTLPDGENRRMLIKARK